MEAKLLYADTTIHLAQSMADVMALLISGNTNDYSKIFISGCLIIQLLP